MSLSVETLAVARKYTDDSLAGAGAVAGVPCKIQSITAITGGNRVTFLWTDNNGDDHTSAMDVMNGVDGEDGKGIQSVSINAQNHLIITYTDGTTVDAGWIEIHSSVDSVNGQTGAVVLDAEDVGALPDNTPIPSKTSDLTNDSGFATTSDVSTALADYTKTADLTTLLAAKQDTLTFDNAPTENSNNPVKSGGVYAVNQTLTRDLANLKDDVEDIKKRIDICYGFEIDGSESNPSSAVTYIADAVGFTPAAMNYGTNAFDYGSWEDAFFMPRPCMLKSDGTVDYYLDPDDYTKKEDGTASDIANTAYDGNAMMEWGRNGRKIWIKIQPSSDRHSAKVWIANNQVDSKFHDYSFHNCKGESAEHFYTPIYNGSVISSKMRSLSGQTVSKTLTGTAEITAAKANNPSTDELWNIECFADRVLINMLLILMGKSLDTQTVFGQGANSGGSEAVNDTFTTGVHDTKGLFYGTNSGAVSANTFGNCVKVFGMENYYGFQWRRTNGLILNNGATKYKLTYGTEDGSATAGYNTDGTNYKDASVTPSGTSGGYISAAKFTEDGMFSDTMSGSASTYFCDGTWFNNSEVHFALFGGFSDGGARVGAFFLLLNFAVSAAYWYLGASVSCKPLA